MTHPAATPYAGAIEARALALALLSGIVCYLAAKLALQLLAHPGGVALFWPSSGLAVGTRLALGRWSERPMAVGIAAATFVANVTGDRNVALALCFAAVNVLEFVVAAWIVERFFGEPFRLNTLRSVLGFFIAAATAAAISALVASLAIMLFSPYANEPFDTFEVWFRSDAIGIIGLAPLLIGLRREPGSRVPLSVHGEGAVLLGLLAAGSFYFFSISPSHGHISTHMSPVAVLFPVLLLIAARLPAIYASAAVAIVTMIVVVTTALGQGRFSDPQLPAYVNLMLAQMVIASAALCALFLAALVSERRASEERQKLLISELDHRVKNSLALMQAVVDRSRESARSIGEFSKSLGGRIRSMARTHSKLSSGLWQGLGLESLIRDELAPYRAAGLENVSGPPIRLKPAAAQAISMVIHELATNAAKYGALSKAQGRTTVRWSIEADGEGGEVLSILWTESGGPLVRPPERASYGTNTIRDLLPYELGGQVALRFDPEGVSCRITLPVTGTVAGTEAASRPQIA